MKIFVAYGYNDRDKWIEKMVFPIIEAFGSEVESGETIYDGSIPDDVRNKIRRSDALIGFTTRRTMQEFTRLKSSQEKLCNFFAISFQA